MPNPAFFKQEFERYAYNGYIGDPNGLSAGAYLRVSTDKQADEGRSGLPRQIKHVHEAAVREGYRISWDYVWADDESGFTLERPALTDMINAFGKPGIPDVLFIEHLDRLSRDVDWQQGYLLHLLNKKCNVNVFFWKQFGSRVERVVMGAISQDGMERSKEIMREGKLLKARDGRINVSGKIAFGYVKAARQGFGNDYEAVKRQTTYAICEGEDAWKVKVVRFVFEQLAYQGWTLGAICQALDAMYPPPGNYKVWARNFLWDMVRNPVYKGQFANFRFEERVVEEIDPITSDVKKVKKRFERPESEWVISPVPAIVSETLWDAANKVLMKNANTAKRNAKTSYLLTGLLKCAVDGYSWNGWATGNTPKTNNIPQNFYYGCHNARIPYNPETKCPTKGIRKEILENAVWTVVRQVLEHPDLLTAYLDDRFASDANQSILDQIDYLKDEITKAERDDGRALELYNVGGYTPQEYKDIHLGYRNKISFNQGKITELQSKFVSQEQVLEQKQFILEMTAQARAHNLGENPPDDIKRALIKIACDEIMIDEPNGQFTIRGEINGTWPIALGKLSGEEGDGSDIASGSSRQSGHNNMNFSYSVVFSLATFTVVSAAIAPVKGASTPIAGPSLLPAPDLLTR